MVVNRSLNHRERGTRTVPLLTDDRPEGNEPADVVIARQRATATAAAIATLQAEQRSVFVLHQLKASATPR